MKKVTVYIDGVLVLTGSVIEATENDDEVELIVESDADDRQNYIIQVPYSHEYEDVNTSCAECGCRH